MTIAQFNNVIAEMHSIFNFDDEKADLLSVTDPTYLKPNKVEITTIEKNTKIRVVMSKYIEGDYYDE